MMSIGDEIVVIDTSNQKELYGYVSRIFPGGRINVYIRKFGNHMEFVNGKTTKGRFKLKEAR